MYKGLGLNKEAQDQLGNPYKLSADAKALNDNANSPYGPNVDNVGVGVAGAGLGGNIVQRLVNKVNGKKVIDYTSPAAIYDQLNRNPYISRELSEILTPFNAEVNTFSGYRGDATDATNIRRMILKMDAGHAPNVSMGQNRHKVKTLANLIDPNGTADVSGGWGKWNPSKATDREQQRLLDWVEGESGLATADLDTTKMREAAKNSLEAASEEAVKNSTKLTKRGNILKNLGRGVGGATGWLGVGAIKDLVINPLLRNKSMQEMTNNQ